MKTMSREERADLICKRSIAEIISDTYYEYQGKWHENEATTFGLRMKGVVIA